MKTTSGAIPSASRRSRTSAKSPGSKLEALGSSRLELGEALGGDRVAVDRDQRPGRADALGDQAGVAAAAERAVDDEVAGPGVGAARSAPGRGLEGARSACRSVWPSRSARGPRPAPRRARGPVRRARRSARPSARGSRSRCGRRRRRPCTGRSRSAWSIRCLAIRTRPAESSDSSAAEALKRRYIIRPLLLSRLRLARKRLGPVFITLRRADLDAGVEAGDENDPV